MPEGPYLAQASPEALVAFETQVSRLQAAGYRVERVPAFPDIARINRRHRQLAAAEFAHEHAIWFAEYRALYRPRTTALIEEGQAIDPELVEEIREGRAVLREETQHLMDVHGVDLWICPAAPGPAPEGLDSTGDPVMNLPWTHVGLPALTVPAGAATNGLPLGLQIVGHWLADERLLAWAEGMAQALETPAT